MKWKESPMNNRTLAELGPLQLAVIAMAASIGSALLVVLVSRLWAGQKEERPQPLPGTTQVRAPERQTDATGADRIPPQPDVETAMPATAPSHFTEELVIPGFTETGADVERDDETLGRSPEGV
jgi:hypothetical protein